MPTYRGNKGNLLQHWVLTELTLLLREQFPPSGRLCLLDAHAMSPYATRDPKPGASAHVFDIVRSGLPGQGSAYERAWSELVGQHRGEVQYPTTAMLVRHLWSGPVSMVLCDTDKTTIDDIGIWKQDISDADTITPHHGDWPQRFRGDFPRATATLVSFDPYMILRENASAVKPGNMYLADLVQATAALCHIPLDRSSCSCQRIRHKTTHCMTCNRRRVDNAGSGLRVRRHGSCWSRQPRHDVDDSRASSSQAP